MKHSLLLSAVLLAGCAASAPGADASPAAPGSLKLEKVVMLMRHGVRPPTKAAVVPPGYSAETWPDWPVDFGLLFADQIAPRISGLCGVRSIRAFSRRFAHKFALCAGSWSAADMHTKLTWP